MNYIYLRISTKEQDLEHQQKYVDDFCKRNEIIPDKIFKDVISGKLKIAKRKQFSELLKIVKSGDVIVARDLSRFGRDLRDVIDNIWDFKEKGIEVVSIKEGINSKMNKFQFITTVSIFAMISEVQRQFISERTADALQYKDRDLLGRPNRIHGKNVSKSLFDTTVNKLTQQGLKPNEIARQIGVHITTIYRHLKKESHEEKRG